MLDRALTDQAGEFAHVMFGGLTHEPAVRLAERLMEITPDGLEHVPRLIRVGERRGRDEDGAAAPARPRHP